MLSIEFVTFIPDKHNLKKDTIYISLKYETSIHLCPCGCGLQAVTPFRGDISWGIDYDGHDGLTLEPSLLNPCGTHYYIRKNEIVPA